MNLLVCKDSEAMASLAHDWCEASARASRARSMFLPAGQTPVPLYRLWRERSPAYLRDLRLLQIDDVLTGPKAGLFKGFFEEHLDPYLGQMEWVGDCGRTADLAILGLGLNGHVAFHEPGLPDGFFGGCVRLSRTTTDTLGLAADTWGITYGAGAFLRARAVLMIATGEKKRPVAAELVRGTGTFPAAALRVHPNFTLILDEAAAGTLRP